MSGNGSSAGSTAAPRVTVVVTCYRQAPYVIAALDSVLYAGGTGGGGDDGSVVASQALRRSS